MAQEVEVAEFLAQRIPQYEWNVEWNANTGHFKVRVRKGIYFGERIFSVTEISQAGVPPSVYLAAHCSEMAKALDQHIAEKTGAATGLLPVDQQESPVDTEALNDFHENEVA